MSGPAAKKPLLAALRGQRQARPPVWLMRQAGRYLPEYRAIRASVPSFLDLCYRPDLATEVTLQPIRRYGFDGAILFSDILVVPDALGASVRFVEGEGPRLEPTRTAAEIDRLDPSRLHGHLAPVYETLRRLSEALPPEVTLLGFAGAPWTLAAYMVEGGSGSDFLLSRKLARTDPALFGKLIDILTDAVTSFLIAQVDAGAQAVQLFDSWAGVLAPDEREKWSVAPIRKIIAGLREARPDVPVVAFPRAVGAGYLAYAGIGAAALSLDTTVPVEWAAKHLGAQSLCLQGNLDPTALLAPVPALLDAAKRVIEGMGDRPFVFNLGHGVVPETPPDNVAALVGYLKSLG
ncbi:MAG: uroporphyrinogen decarboxylase [Geminicoccaceae bacterium]